MTILLDHIILMLAASVLGYPLLRRPLSEDDGNWYYYACFQDRGVRLYRGFTSTYGYFGIFGIAAWLVRLFRMRTPLFFNYFKVIWYLLNSLSLYWLTFLWSSNHGMALIAALMLTLVTSVPNTLFPLTYAEHFMILPFCLSLIGLFLGLAGNGHGFFLAAGLFAGWAVQIKPTALIYAVALLPFCWGSTSAETDGAIYLSAVVGINILPCFLLGRDGQAWRVYLFHTFGGALGLIAILLDRVNVRFLRRLVPGVLRTGRSFAYLQGHHQLTLKEQGTAFWRFMGPALKDLRLFVILASVQGYGILTGRFDPLTLIMFALVLVCLFMQQIQKNYYTPHFNTVWMPLSVLAGKTIWEAGASAIQGGILGLAVIVLLMFEGYRIAGAVIPSFRKQARESAAFQGPILGALFCLSEKIGEYIRHHSQPNEKLLVWGDQPSVYLYADRQCFNPDYLFLYTHTGRIHDEEERHKFLDLFRQASPEWVLFYQYKYADGWTMKRLEEETGIPYLRVTQFRLKDRQRKVIQLEGGIDLVFPLYRRDEDRFRAVLLERAAFALFSSDQEAYRTHLNKITDVYPEDPEARIRLEALERYGANAKGLLLFLENRQDHLNPMKACLVSQMLGDLHRHEGRLEEAARRYEEASVGRTHDFRLYSGLAEIAYTRGDMEGAMQFLERAYQINPFSAEVHNSLGVLYSFNGDPERAGLFFRKALKMIPRYQDAIDNLEQLSSGNRVSNDTVQQ